jgi:nucleoside-diphosphate-sugar epimerase
MVIGNGDIASVLPDRKDLLFFASGVSNSQETRELVYQREIDLLDQQAHAQHIVYFSSLSVFYNDNRYTQHKMFMEKRIKSNFEKYTIIRIGNITWGDNPHTLINFIRNHIENKLSFEVKDVYRYIIDKDEFLHWINLIPAWSCEMNITGARMSVRDIITKYGQLGIHIE